MKAGRTLGATLGAGFVLAIAVAPHAGPAAHDPAQACHKVELIDRLTNDVITGIEDIEIDLINGMAILSAHDRWALEGALARKSDRLPRGGLYALAMDWSGRPPATISLDDLSAGFTQEKDFRPQGLALSHQGSDQRLFVVNQRYEESGDVWHHSPTIEVFDLTVGGLAHRRSLENPLICRPNAVAVLGSDTLLVTNDHGACGSGAWLEDLMPLDRANLVRITLAENPPYGRVAAAGFRFANGLAVSPAGDRRVYLADTRKSEIAVFSSTDLQAELRAMPTTTLRLPDGPDNLRWAPDGRLITAVHPDLLTLGLYVKRWLGVERAPSRVAAISPNDGAIEILFDDPDGTLISAATAAAVHDGWLLIGSAFDRGLVVCRLTEPKPARQAQP